MVLLGGVVCPAQTIVNCTSAGPFWGMASYWGCGVNASQVPNNDSGNVYNATMGTHDDSLSGTSGITINSLTVDPNLALDFFSQSLTLVNGGSSIRRMGTSTSAQCRQESTFCPVRSGTRWWNSFRYGLMPARPLFRWTRKPFPSHLIRKLQNDAHCPCLDVCGLVPYGAV